MLIDTEVLGRQFGEFRDGQVRIIFPIGRFFLEESRAGKVGGTT